MKPFRNIGANLYLVVTISFVLLFSFMLYRFYRTTKEQLQEAYQTQTELALRFDVAIRDYVAKEIRPVMYKLAGRDTFIPQTMSTTYVARKIFEDVKKGFPGYRLKFSSDNPRNPANRASKEELEMIRFFNENPGVEEWSGRISLDGHEYMAMFRAARMEQDCLLCHGVPQDAPRSLLEQYGDKAGFHRPMGEVIALDTVAIPLHKMKQALAAELRTHILSLLVVCGLALLLIAATIKVVVANRLQTMATHFRNMAELRDYGAIEPLEVRGEDEIRQVADSFNVLALELKNGYLNLEKLVNERTSLLLDANKNLSREKNKTEQIGIFYKTVLDALNDAVSILDVKTCKILAVNRVFLEQHNLAEEAVVGRSCYEVTHDSPEPCSPPNDPCPMLETAKFGAHAMYEHVHHDAGGRQLFVEVSTSPIMNDSGEVIQVVHVTRDVTERKDAEKKIYQLAYFDNLTGLPNRTLFHDRLEHALWQAKRYRRTMALLSFDIDNFKRINESLGHPVGDMLIRDLSGRIAESLRKSDTFSRNFEGLEGERDHLISRFDGDQFMILLTEINKIEDSAQVARRVLTALGEPFRLAGHEIFVTASIGIALFPMDGTDADELIMQADTAVYCAKEAGKNMFKFFTATMNAVALEQLSLESELRRGLERQEFEVVYQPQIELQTGRVVGAEALVRWNHPHKGVISPLQFIPLAEETGLIITLGEWVLRTACLQCKEWIAAGHESFHMAVNLSSVQFKDELLLGRVRDVLQETGLRARNLVLEITESILMQQTGRTMKILEGFGEMGLRIAMDDFGTGYSSLSYLKQFPLDIVKIDRSFIRDLMERKDNKAITKAIVAMAHSLDLEVVAEGVETEEQLLFLYQEGCDSFQGFLASTPQSAAAFEAVLAPDAASEHEGMRKCALAIRQAANP